MTIGNTIARILIAADPALADIFLWTLSAERRTAAVASRPVGLDRRLPSVGRYLPTVDLWRTDLVSFVVMDRHEPLRDLLPRHLQDLR